MSGPVANVQIDKHPQQGDEYLNYIETGPTGNYKSESFDPKAIMRIDATVTQDGNYSAHMYNANGDCSHTIHGGSKDAANSKTDTTTNHAYTGIGEGHSENVGHGHFTQTLETKSAATDGPNIHASKSTPMVLSPAGHGIHAVQGDQSHTVNDGGMHYSIDKGYAVKIKGSMDHNVLGDVNATVGGSEGHTSGKNTSLDAAQEIRFTCGASSIVMVPGSITITSPAVFFVKG